LSHDSSKTMASFKASTLTKTSIKDLVKSFFLPDEAVMQWRSTRLIMMGSLKYTRHISDQRL
jgi:hypothetical protein